jgi:GxxExxY protein
MESVYQTCLKKEFLLTGIKFRDELRIPINYKGTLVEAEYRLDFLVEEQIVVELKAVESLLPVHEAQLLTYMKLLKKSKGILINFNCANIVKEGTKQMVNEYFYNLNE